MSSSTRTTALQSSLKTDSISESEEKNSDEKSTASTALNDYSSETSAMFGNLRIPAALFAGASAGAVYAMPVTVGDTVLRGFVKRLYTILMMYTLSCQIVTIVVGTAVMAGIAGKEQSGTTTTTTLAPSLHAWIERHYPAEWTTVNFHFLAGIVSFSVASGLRAWLTIVCPVLGLVTLGIISSGTLLSLAFVQDIERQSGSSRSLWRMPMDQFKLLWQFCCKRNLLYTLAALVYLTTMVYAIVKIPHLYHYLSTSATAI